jgi:AraC-like DNA-binding protein
VSGRSDDELFGGVAEAFRLYDAQRLLIRGLDAASLAVTEIVNDRRDFGMTDPMPFCDGYMLGVQLRAIRHHELWFDDRQMDVDGVEAGDSLFYDLKRSPRAYVVDPSHSVHFILTRALLDEVAGELQLGRFDELELASGVPVRDKVLARLGRAMSAALERPKEVNDLFASHLMIALAGYVARTFSNRSPGETTDRLGPAEMRLAQEWMRANLAGVDMRQLAQICRRRPLSFAAAFRQTAGIAPYQWLLLQRLDSAKDLLSRRRHSIAEIASLCGFADEQHLDRVLMEATGLSVANYRQSIGSGLSS